MTGMVHPVSFPLPQGGSVIEFAWQLFLDGKVVARSSDYFPSEAAAQTALEEALAAMAKASVVGPVGCKTCAGWGPSPTSGMQLRCRDCGRVV